MFPFRRQMELLRDDEENTGMEYLTHRGYRGTVEYSGEDQCLFGRVVGIKDLISYEGRSIEEIRACFTSAVDDYLEHCRELGVKPEKPASGKISLRIESDLHQAVSQLAELEGMSLNAWIAEQLREKAQELQ